ncbi:proteasome endopeptidase complex [Malassezia nana]|uniref:Proteasome endopeptidase complex n=1 Tax=Malassezia nana TaxID=180528 RepID=A0AAF0EPQ2_9BASI|nr:proteasome endopeptidase complex [Malassezia nana]
MIEHLLYFPQMARVADGSFQVDYALEAVRKGTCAVGIRGKDVAVLGVERKSLQQLQDPRTVRKTAMLDDHICLAFAGLNADARILIDRARVECQSHRLTKYTQSGGMRPFGISTLIIGFDHSDPTPRLYQTEPSGMFSAWKANAIGRSSKTVREFLEKNYKEDMSQEDAVKLAIKSLLEVVQTGAKNIEVTVMTGHGQRKMLALEEVEAVVKVIEAEHEAEAERRRTRLAATASAEASMS